VQFARPELIEAFVNLARTVAGDCDLTAFCTALANLLRRVVCVESVRLFLNDPTRTEPGLVASSSEREIVLTDKGDKFVAAVWRERKHHVIRNASDPGALILLPLCNEEGQLGVLEVGVSELPADNEKTFDLLQGVASELVLVLRSYLARRTLQQEHNRMRVLLEITNSLVSRLPIEELFPAISEQLSRVVAHDVAWVGRVKNGTGLLTITGLHSPVGIELERDEDQPPEGMPHGEAIATGKPVTTSASDMDRFRSPLFRKYVDLGFRSACAVPFKGRSGLIGVLDLARISGEPFTEDELDLLVLTTGRLQLRSKTLSLIGSFPSSGTNWQPRNCTSKTRSGQITIWAPWSETARHCDPFSETSRLLRLRMRRF
jgi:transcriptional regulator with GAF, ATPase, and Fis domain